MKNKFISLLTNLFLFFLFTSQINASEQAWKIAQEGDKIILIRHSLAPGGGDPAGFKVDDCKTQRNLNRTGINQSKKIGKLFTANTDKSPRNQRQNLTRIASGVRQTLGVYSRIGAP